MSNLMKQFVAAALGGAALVGVVAAEARAQGPTGLRLGGSLVRPGAQALPPTARLPQLPPRGGQVQVLPNSSQIPNNNFLLDPRTGLRLNQYVHNVREMGDAWWHVPWWMTGYRHPVGWTPRDGWGPAPSVATMTSVPSGSGDASPGSGFSPAGPGPAPDSFGSHLQGGAAVIQAQGQFLESVQQANLTREHVRQKHIENQRAAFDLRRYEEAHTPSLQDRREQAQDQERRRALTAPPAGEIYSAHSLNVLLKEAQARQRLGGRGPALSLADEVVRQVNVTTGSGGHPGLLKEGGLLRWPLALHGPEYDTSRRRVERVLPGAVRQARYGSPVDVGILQSLEGDVEQLRARLAAHIKDLTVAQYSEAKRFLNDLGEATKALRQKDVRQSLAHQGALRGKNVVELVQYMTDHGLKFAPAVAGDEPAYRVLHQALAAYTVSGAEVARP